MYIYIYIYIFIIYIYIEYTDLHQPQGYNMCSFSQHRLPSVAQRSIRSACGEKRSSRIMLRSPSDQKKKLLNTVSLYRDYIHHKPQLTKLYISIA